MIKTIASSKGTATETITAPAHSMSSGQNDKGHRKLEGMVTVFTVLALCSILVGTIIEIIPTFNIAKYTTSDKMVEPWTALELAGRDVYIREGCYLCHSQQIRPMAAEVLRYGNPSTIEESMWDHPFQWGSKRIGPDIARVGAKYPNLWHYRHMQDPRSVTPNSIMPNYPWLYTNNTDYLILRKKLSVMKTLGVPYSPEQSANADIDAQKQAKVIADDLVAQGAPAGLESKEITALIAYLQALGQKAKK